MRNAVVNFLDQSQAFLINQTTFAQKGSPAAHEHATFCRPVSVENIWSITDLLIEAAADELQAFVRITEPPVQTKSPFTCVRSCLESAALATWFLDPCIDANERVKRSMCYLYEGLLQNRKFARISPIIVSPEVAAIEAQLDELDRIGNETGCIRIDDKNGKRVGLGMQFPKITDLVASQLDEERTYRLLSAAAHSHLWALLHLSFAEAKGSDTPRPPAEHRFFEKTLSPDTLHLLCVKGVKVFAKVLWRKCQYFGWDIFGIEKVLDDAFIKLRIDKRFWRPT